MSAPGTQLLRAPEAPQVVEYLFRHEAGKMVATLAHIFGVEHLTLAEDVVQEALHRALRIWPYHGVPENPSGWLMRTARNLALDVVRRDKVFRDKQPEIIVSIERQGPEAETALAGEHDIGDDRLRLMFVCCHPLIPTDAQAALALKTLCGFSVTEIGHAFLSTDAAVAKRLTRARRKIREARIPFELPTGEELARRLDGVLHTLYLLFNEGYKASCGARLIREEVCREAIRLGSLLVGHPACCQAKVHALLALMLLNAARSPARIDAEGNLLRLTEQDRSHWDQAALARGMFHLAQSASGDTLSRYHLEAGIAACHCAAKDYESTDWVRILELYDRLLEIDDSPVIALNRAVAVANVQGPAVGLLAIEVIPQLAQLSSYYLLYAVMGELEARRSRFSEALGHFKHALKLTRVESERAFLFKRIQECDAPHKAVKEPATPVSEPLAA